MHNLKSVILLLRHIFIDLYSLNVCHQADDDKEMQELRKTKLQKQNE